MPLPTPEQVAAAQAAIRRKPDGAQIVEAPHDDLVDVQGQAHKKGTPLWRYPSGRQAGGPMDAYAVAHITEYSYRSLESAARLGWKEN